MGDMGYNELQLIIMTAQSGLLQLIGIGDGIRTAFGCIYAICA